MLFKFNFSSSFFQCFLQRFCFVFSQTFFYYTRSTVNQVLCFLQTKTASFLNGFNDLKFSCTSTLQYYVERSFFLNSGTSGCGASSNSNSCSSRFNTIFLFQDCSKFINFFYCQVN